MRCLTILSANYGEVIEHRGLPLVAIDSILYDIAKANQDKGNIRYTKVNKEIQVSHVQPDTACA